MSPLLALVAIPYAVMLWIDLALGAKRCHDRGRSGWFQLLYLVPIANIWLLIDIGFLRGVPETNRWGPPVDADAVTIAATG